MEVVFWLPMVLLKVPCFLNWVQAKEKTNRSKKGERRKRQDDTKSETWQFFPLSHISSPIFFTSLLPIRSMELIWNFQLTFALSCRNLDQEWLLERRLYRRERRKYSYTLQHVGATTKHNRYPLQYFLFYNYRVFSLPGYMFTYVFAVTKITVILFSQGLKITL